MLESAYGISEIQDFFKVKRMLFLITITRFIHPWRHQWLMPISNWLLSTTELWNTK